MAILTNNGGKMIIPLKTWTRLFLMLLIVLGVAGVADAHPAKTIALLEEHNVAPGVRDQLGAQYTVPAGRKAKVSGFFCEIRSHDPTGTSQIALVVIPSWTVRTTSTPTTGMNPVNCLNSTVFHTWQASGATITMLPGDILFIFFTNTGPYEVFMLGNALILEEDL
jgi:hypothetical protein